jgi:hypothetical protein
MQKTVFSKLVFFLVVDDLDTTPSTPVYGTQPQSSHAAAGRVRQAQYYSSSTSSPSTSSPDWLGSQ